MARRSRFYIRWGMRRLVALDLSALENGDDLVDILWRCSAIYAAALGIGLRGD